MQFTNKQIWHIAYPVLISLLMEHLVGLTDTAYLGRVGEVELGASALAGVYYLVVYMLGFGFSVGAQILMARCNGSHDYKRIGPIFMQGVLFLFVFAIVLFTLSHIYSPVILRQIIDSDDVYRATMDYVDWRVYGFFFSYISVMFRAFYVGITKTKILTINSVVMVMTNVVLNYVLIFGKFGFPMLGIAGAAIASAVSEAVSAVFFIIYTWRKVDYRKYAMFERFGLDLRIQRQIFGVSFWIMIQNGISFVGWFVFFIFMEHQGERPLAITNVVRSISSFMFMFVNAFGSTSSSLVSNLIGAGEQDKVLGLCRRMIRLCYCFVLPLGAIIAVFPELFLRIYTDNLDLVGDAVPSLWVMLSSYLLAVPGFIFFFSVSGTGNTQKALIIEVFSMVLYVSYAYVVCVWLHADVAVCWTTEHVYDTMLLIFPFLYLWKGNWRNQAEPSLKNKAASHGN